MPENIETFENTYLDKSYDPEFRVSYYKSIKNINTLKSLMAGKISYLRGELPIKTIIETIQIPMGDYQESEYSKVRAKEIQLSKVRRMGDDDENLANLRSKSRQICNIYIPNKNEEEV